MARIANQEEREHLLTVAKGRPPKYPWAEWANGEAWVVTQGEDFTTSINGFQQSLWSHSRRIGKTFRSRKDGNRVIFQFGVQA